MILTAENYFSREASEEYLSVSQYKDFIGTLGRPACEELALAKLHEEWDTEKSTALLVGSYVDAHFEGTLNTFKAQNPDIFTKSGDLKAEYKRANEIINRIERDPLFMKYMSGEKQVIMEAELFGAKWKVKLDSYHPDNCIVDLKTMKSLRESEYTKDFGHMNFVRYWGYDLQAAIYQKVVEIKTGKKLPFYIAAASKEKEPDIELIQIEQTLMDEALASVEVNIPKILALKNGEIDPVRCESCDWCKHTKVLTAPIWSSALLGEI
ncbi:MAG: PD-(D/E)XK nuclease-like domain-containing protein [Candidatus Cloacimonetes bacterium]|nr:PD-(D/E)XK nuclease-like domain-containing protein [Candidatus Cloacimonadota bacterium]